MGHSTKSCREQQLQYIEMLGSHQGQCAGTQSSHVTSLDLCHIMQPFDLTPALHAQLDGHGAGRVQVAVPEVLQVLILLYHCMPVSSIILMR